MNINQISAQNFGTALPKSTRKLVPISEYKGPILRLTKSDKFEINRLKNEIIKLELEHFDLSKYIACAKHISRGVQDKLDFIGICIQSLNEQIQNIKTSRLQKQIIALQV